MVFVLADASGVGHDMRNVMLLLDSMKKMSHGAFGEDGHVFTAMSLHAQGNGRLSLIVVVLWGEKKEEFSCYFYCNFLIFILIIII